MSDLIDSFPPCIDCKEEPGSCPAGRCRDCDIDYLFRTWPKCEHCHQLQYNEVWRFGDIAEEDINHTADCPDRMLRFQFLEARDRYLMVHHHDPLVRLAARNRDQARLYEQAMRKPT